MCKGYACCLVALLAAVTLVSIESGAQSAQAPAPAAQPSVQTFVVIYERGTAWDASKPPLAQASIPEHIQFIRASIDRLVGAGPFLEALSPNVADGMVGMVIVQAANVEEVQALLSKDPALISNVMQIKVRNWQVEHVKGF